MINGRPNVTHEVIVYYDECTAFVNIPSLIPNCSRVEVVVANTIPDFFETWLSTVLPG